jgi:Protein of unknown function (DUF3309)
MADLLLFRCDGGSTVNPLVVLIVVLLILSLPTWPYSAAWGFYPSGGIGILLLVLLVLLLSRRRI